MRFLQRKVNITHQVSKFSHQSKIIRSFLSSSNDVGHHFTVTNACVNRIRQIVLKGMPDVEQTSTNSYPARALRVIVTPGGCQGFNYSFSFETTDKIDREKDLWIKVDNDVLIVLRKKVFSIIKGSTLDFRSELRGSYFTLRDNPNSNHACSCGSSFSVKKSYFFHLPLSLRTIYLTSFCLLNFICIRALDYATERVHRISAEKTWSAT